MLGGIGQGKGRHCEFEVTIPGPKCDFGDVFSFNLELMVSRPQINLRKDSRFMNSSNKSSIWGKGYWFFCDDLV